MLKHLCRKNYKETESGWLKVRIQISYKAAVLQIREDQSVEPTNKNSYRVALLLRIEIKFDINI